MNKAEKLANFLLEDAPVPEQPTSGQCAQCEIEHYGRTRPGSHSWCKRHFIEWFKQNGMSDAQVQDVLSTNPVMAPDMGPVANPQQKQGASVMWDTGIIPRPKASFYPSMGGPSNA